MISSRSLSVTCPSRAASTRAWPEPGAADAWARPASVAQTPPPSTTWSLSPESPRWYVVALPPPGAPAGVPSAVGVMAQVDIGKALAQL